MNKVEIILDWKYSLDGYDPSQVIALTFAEAEFNSLASRGGTLSIPIKVAKTANNTAILGQPDENRSQSSRPYTQFDCQIRVNEQPIFYGLAQLEESQDFYSLRIFSGLTDFFKLLKDKTLNQLNLSAQNHTWTAANVRAATNANSNYCYPAINYGRWTGTSLTKDHTDFFPAVFFKYLLETSATEQGWTLNNYSEVYGIPFSKQDFNNDLGCEMQVSASSDVLCASPLGFNILLDVFDTIDNDPTGHAFDYSVFSTSYGYELREGGTYDFRAKIDYDLASGSNPNFFAAIVEIDSIGVVTNVFSPVVGSNGITVPGTLNLNAFGVEYNANKYITVGFLTPGSSGVFTMEVLAGSTFNCVKGREPIKSGGTINLADTLPDIKVKDLFLFEATRLNALIVANPLNKSLEFVTFDSIEAQWPVAVDWSDKVDLTTKPRYRYRLDSFAQNNLLRWKEGSENEPAYRVNNQLGNYTLTIDDGNLEDEKVIYTAPFAASAVSPDLVDTSTSPNTTQVHLRITRYTSSSLAFDEPDNNPVARCCKLESSTNNLVQITLAPSSVTAQIQGTFETWDEITDSNYTAFEAVLSRYKEVEVFVNLNAEDIQKLDFTRPVKLLDNYWFIRKVNQWAANRAGSTKVELIRL